MSSIHDILTELDERRRQLGMSCEVLAERCGVSSRTIRRLLRSEAESARIATVAAMAEALGASIGIVRKRRITAVRNSQAKAKAKKIVAMAQANAALEGQGVSGETRKLAEQKVTAGLLSSTNVRLWAK